MKRKISRGKAPDPRTCLILLLFANLITFFQNSIWIEAGWICFLGGAMLAAGQYKMTVKWIFTYGVILLLQYVLFPAAPRAITEAFFLLVNYARRMFPCLIAGAFMIRVTSLRQFILAMRKMHLPQKLIIPISVTIRYFPAIKEEMHYIKDAMKLRNIRGAGKLEAVIVLLMISATATAEELSAAAVTRGIENPVPKTSVTEIKFRLRDYLYGFAALLFMAGTFVIK